jgi:protein ImuA
MRHRKDMAALKRGHRAVRWGGLTLGEGWEQIENMRPLPLNLPDDDGLRHLPEAGLAYGAVHEMRGPAESFAHVAFAVLALAGLPEAVRLFWVSTVQNAYPPGLAWLGLDPGKILFAQARDDAECLGSLEVALRGGMAGIAEAGSVSRLAARRLGLAARQGGAIGFLLRHAPRRTAQDSSAVATRWFIEPVAGGMRAELLYAKAGRPGAFLFDIREGLHGEAPPALVAVSGWGEPERRRATG